MTKSNRDRGKRGSRDERRDAPTVRRVKSRPAKRMVSVHGDQRQADKRFPDVEILMDDGVEVSEELRAAGMARGEELREQFAAAHQSHRDESDALIELHPSLKNMRLTCMYDEGCRTVDKPVAASLRQTERFWTIFQEQGVRVKVNNLTRAALYVWSDAAVRAFPEIRQWGEQFCARCAGLAWERFLTLLDASMLEVQPIERLSRSMWQTNAAAIEVIVGRLNRAVDETMEIIECDTLDRFTNEQLNKLHFSLRQLANRPMPIFQRVMGAQPIDEALAQIDRECAVWLGKGTTRDERAALLHRLDREVRDPHERTVIICRQLPNGPLETDWDAEMYQYLTPQLIEQLRVTLVGKLKEVAMSIDELMIRIGDGEPIGFEAGVDRILELVSVSSVSKDAEHKAVQHTA